MKQEKKLVNFRISEALAEELKEAAEIKEVPQSHIVRDAIKKEVKAVKAEAQEAEMEAA